jgi:hypothetical protein
MSDSFFAFPSIEQFRNVVKAVRERSAYVGRDENGDAIKDFGKALGDVARKFYLGKAL